MLDVAAPAKCSRSPTCRRTTRTTATSSIARAHAQSRGHRHVRAGLDAEAVHGRRGAGGRRDPARYGDPDRAGLRSSIGNATIHDAHPAGRADGRAGDPEIVQRRRREDRALAAAARRCGDMFSDAGFGTAPQTGFPGEVAGRLRPTSDWKPIEQATMSYGHGISVNLRAARARLHDLRDRRRTAAARRWCKTRQAASRARR